MARMLIALVAIAAALAVLAPAASAAGSGVLVRFSKSADASERQAARADAGTKLDEVLPLPRLQLVKPEPGVSTGEAIDRLNASPEVLYAEPDRIRHATTVPNDNLFGLQWGLDNTGQDVNGTVGTAGADIDAPEAWNVTTGDPAVTVGVVDSGIDATQPDLAPNIWTNPNEIVNGVDDDGNGLVDDVHGWDFVGNDSSPADLNGHGTHVSGTLGARGNDSTGVAGVAWNVKLAPLRVLDATGSGSVSNVIKGYTYASQKGIRVVNASLGSLGYSQAEHDALAAAGNTLFVVAAGNGGADGIGDNNDVTPEYPCAYDLPNIVCVAATDSNDALASFSNFGTLSVDLAAPGVGIASTWPTALAPCSGTPCWTYLDGTSMATPHVAGTAALVWSHNPTASVAEVKQALLSSVDPKPGLAATTVSGGRLNAYRAVTGISPPPPPPAPRPPASQPAPTPAPAAPVAVVDRTAPLVGIAFVRGQSLRSLARSGLRLRVRCSEACSLRSDLFIGRAVSSRQLGRVSARISRAGVISVRIRLTAVGRRALRHARLARLSVRVRAADPKGNARTVARTIRLR